MCWLESSYMARRGVAKGKASARHPSTSTMCRMANSTSLLKEVALMCASGYFSVTRGFIFTSMPVSSAMTAAGHQRTRKARYTANRGRHGAFGIRQTPVTVQRCGADQLLFGSGAPIQHGAASLSKIVHAAIPDSAREQILGANLCRLLGEN